MHFDRATSNETLANGADIASAARSFFPSLTDDGVQAIEEVRFEASRNENSQSVALRPTPSRRLLQKDSDKKRLLVIFRFDVL